MIPTRGGWLDPTLTLTDSKMRLLSMNTLHAKGVDGKSAPPNQPDPPDPNRDEALKLHSLGFWPIAIYPKGVMIGDKIKAGKEPIGEKWGLTRWSEAKIRQKFAANRGAGVGMCFGPDRAPG